jgi:acyl-CoA thioesterase
LSPAAHRGEADAVEDTAFGRQLALTPDPAVAGRYTTELSDVWNCPFVPHGGLATAVAARAMELELAASAQPLRSVTNVFAAQVPAGPVVIDVTVLRRGRSMSQVAATMRAPDARVGHTSVAVLGASRPGFEFTDVFMPDVPPPEECPSFRDEAPPGAQERPSFNFWEQVEGRAAAGHAPWDEYVPTTSERGAWYRFDEPPMLDDGALHPLALVTLCDTMPGAVGERLGPARVSWFPPSADLTVHVFGRAECEWVLGRNRARIAGDGYASVEIELWDPGRAELVAYGTQLMFFNFPDGPPAPEDLRPSDAR